MKKRYLSLLLVIILTAVLCVPALAVVDKSSDFYVADYAGVLQSSTKSSIINYNGALEKQCSGAQIVVVTVQYLDGMTSSEYAMQLFNNWGVGSSKYNNGVLLLLATQENKYWVQCGSGLTGTSFESDVGGKMSKFEKYFDAGQYDDAVNYIFGVMMKWFDGQYGSAVASSGSSSSSSSSSGSQSYSGQQSYSGGFDVFSLLIRLFIIYIFISAIVKSIRRSYFARTGSWLPLFLFFGPCRPYWGYRPGPHSGRGFDWDDHDHHGGFGGGSGFGGGGFGGGGFGGGGGGGGFGGGMGGGGGGFGGGGFGRN